MKRTQPKKTLRKNRQPRFAFCADVQVVPWEARAASIVSRLARAGKVFSTDDVWLQLSRAGVTVPVVDRREMGNVLRAAKRRRLIRSAGVCQSVRASRQGGYVTMWRAA